MKLFSRSMLAVWVIAVPAAVACGGGQATTETPQGGSSSASGTPPPQSASASASAPTSWKDMDHNARLAFMKGTVMPKMHDEFAAADKKWSDINCGTCHGDGAKAGTFKMPNPKLPVLPGDKDGFAKLFKEKPASMTFMKDKVVPDMAAMLGEAPYDPATQKGFGCAECHTFAGK
jgi:hypothetical protein